MILVSTKERILQYLEYKGINKTEFYKITGMKRGLIDGDKLNSAVPDTALAKIIEHFPELNLEWLISGTGQMLRGSVNYPSASRGNPQVSDKSQPYTFGNKPIPLYDPESGGFADLINGVRTYTPVDSVSIPGSPICDGALRVRSDSMYPVLKSGDIVLYRSLSGVTDEVIWGEVYIVAFDSGGEEYVAVNYVHKSEQEGCVRLSGHTQQYAPKDIPVSKIKAIALVKASIGYKTMG